MLEDIRVGLPFIAGPYKYEAAEKLQALTNAVSSLPKIERPKLYLVITAETLTAATLPPPYIALFDGVIFMGEDIKKTAATFGSSLIQTISHDQLFKKIDYYFAVSPDVLPNQRAAIWMSTNEQNCQDAQTKKIAEHATTVVFTDWSAEQAFLKEYPSTKVISKLLSIPHYPENKWYEGDPLSIQRNYELPDRFVLCPNHFRLENNHPVLFRAIALLRRQGQDVHLACTGLTTDPSHPDYFEKLQEYGKQIGITDLIHILGPLPHHDTIQLIRRSLFVVEPGLDKTLSTIVQECRALAKPILLANTSDNSMHLPQGYGIYCQIADYKDLAQKFSALLSTSQPGPAREQEAVAKQECVNSSNHFARQFCDIVREAVTLISVPSTLDNQQRPKTASENAENISPAQLQQPETKKESINWANRLLVQSLDIIKPRLSFGAKETVSHLNHPSAVNASDVVTIATSLVPKDVDNQKKAINSWKNLGFRVVSINAPEEMDILRPNFPDMEFVAATRDARARYGKPYIYFDDFLTYFTNQDCRICGMINSDIHLDKDNFHAIVYKEAMNSLVYGPRVNVDSLDTSKGTMDIYGFDYFFFDKRLISCFPQEEFCIGLPLWDYWVPLVAASNKVPMKKIVTPVAYHVKHHLNYEQKTLVSLSFTLAKYFPPPYILSADTASKFGVFWQSILREHTNELTIE